MVDYNCVECGKNVNSNLTSGRIRCPFCDSKALRKKGSVKLDAIKAR